MIMKGGTGGNCLPCAVWPWSLCVDVEYTNMRGNATLMFTILLRMIFHNQFHDGVET